MAQTKEHPRLFTTSRRRAPAKPKHKQPKNRGQIGTQIRRHRARRPENESAVIATLLFSWSCICVIFDTDRLPRPNGRVGALRRPDTAARRPYHCFKNLQTIPLTAERD